MAGFRTYDIKNVVITINGAPLVGGFAPDSKVTISSDNDRYTHTADVDGFEAIRSRNHDEVVTVTLKTIQGSTTNSILSGLSLADKLTNGGAFLLTISEVGNPTSALVSADAYIVKDPDEDFNKEVSTREWTIRATFPARSVS